MKQTETLSHSPLNKLIKVRGQGHLNVKVTNIVKRAWSKQLFCNDTYKIDVGI